jgi:hypothetical protein
MSKLPVVKKEPDGSFVVQVGQSSYIRWRYDLDANGTLVTVTIDTPTPTKWYDEARNTARFPVSTLQ